MDPQSTRRSGSSTDPAGGAAIHLPDLADPAYQAIVRADQPHPRFQYNGWLHGQQAIPEVCFALEKTSSCCDSMENRTELAVRAVEIQLKHHWQHLDYKLVP